MTYLPYNQCILTGLDQFNQSITQVQFKELKQWGRNLTDPSKGSMKQQEKNFPVGWNLGQTLNLEEQSSTQSDWGETEETEMEIEPGSMLGGESELPPPPGLLPLLTCAAQWVTHSRKGWSTPFQRRQQQPWLLTLEVCAIQSISHWCVYLSPSFVSDNKTEWGCAAEDTGEPTTHWLIPP